jgi:hypothetical protein
MKRFHLFPVFAILAVLSAAPAGAAVDAHGRPWFGVVSWSACPGADQFVGVQLVQMRRALPGVWTDVRIGPDLTTGSGGLAFLLFDGLAARVGAVVADRPDDLSVGFAYGLTATWRRLSVHAGFDSETDARTFGAGVTFWR